MNAVNDIYHASHCVKNLPAADEWFAEVLGARLLFSDYVESALRDASFWVVGGVLWEVCSPADIPGAAEAPLGRFNRRFGDRLHSFSWWVGDMQECVRSLLAEGVRVMDVSGHLIDEPSAAHDDDAVFTHPSDMYGMFEFAGPTCTPYCRVPAEAPAVTEHPLGIAGVSHMTVLLKDREVAAVRLLRVLGGRILPTPAAASTSTRSTFLDLGSSVLELREVPASGTQADWHERNGDGAHSIAFHVDDLSRAATFLDGVGVGYDEAGAGLLRLRPDHAFGVAYELVSAPVNQD